ncbi:MAG: hypothetical protein AVDCRST_MAG88-2810, partial [uncultured Thermomicrobiales bacterium]
WYASLSSAGPAGRSGRCRCNRSVRSSPSHCCSIRTGSTGSVAASAGAGAAMR